MWAGTRRSAGGGPWECSDRKRLIHGFPILSKAHPAEEGRDLAVGTGVDDGIKPGTAHENTMKAIVQYKYRSQSGK